jgi:cytochrome c
MKKLILVVLVALTASWTMTSCGGKKEEGKEDEQKEEAYDEYETAEPKKESSDELIKQGQLLVDQSDCKTCHHATNKIIGPAHAEVAKKYEFTQGNVTMLAGKIIKGGSGVWGEIPMTAHPDISQSDAERMAMYVLSLDGEKPADR